MEGIFASLEQWGYVLLFGYCIGGGYVGLIVACMLSAMGKMDIYMAIAVACMGNIFGSSLFVLLARYQKREILKLFKNHKRKLAFSYIWLRRYGLWLIVFSKYIYGAKTIVPLAIGFSGFNLKRFMVVNVFSCALWACVVGILGFYASSGILMILERLDSYPFLMPIVFGVFAFILYVLVSKISQRAQKL